MKSDRHFYGQFAIGFSPHARPIRETQCPPLDGEVSKSFPPSRCAAAPPESTRVPVSAPLEGEPIGREQFSRLGCEGHLGYSYAADDRRAARTGKKPFQADISSSDETKTQPKELSFGWGDCRPAWVFLRRGEYPIEPRLLLGSDRIRDGLSSARSEERLQVNPGWITQ